MIPPCGVAVAWRSSAQAPLMRKPRTIAGFTLSPTSRRTEYVLAEVLHRAISRQDCEGPRFILTVPIVAVGCARTRRGGSTSPGEHRPPLSERRGGAQRHRGLVATIETLTLMMETQDRQDRRRWRRDD
jgi:hypothetical protein